MKNTEKRQSYKTKIGDLFIGDGGPVIIQSMTDTVTSNVDATLDQVMLLADAGSEIVRITVNNIEAAKAVPKIRERLDALGYTKIPLVGCFHYNGHTLLNEVDDCAAALAKYRINPGNVGFGEKMDLNFNIMIQCAIKHNKPVRIGVNWGSLDKELVIKAMDENAKLPSPLSSREIFRNVAINSCILSAQKAEMLGMPPQNIVLSAKMSQVQDLIYVYTELAERTKYALHLGLTEAGMGMKGIVSISAAISILLEKGIGDTIRASLTPSPNEPRINEVLLCQNILQALELRSFRPSVTACPGCGRTDSVFFRQLAEEIDAHISASIKQWRVIYPGVENLRVAVMGCIVNGPGESKHADIGISLPGIGENMSAPVFINGEKKHTLRGENIANEFRNILDNYIREKYK